MSYKKNKISKEELIDLVIQRASMSKSDKRREIEKMKKEMSLKYKKYGL